MLTQQHISILCQLSRDDYTTDRKYLKINVGLTAIPTDIPTDALEVHIRDNTITTLEANVFSDLSQCKMLNLFRNGITKVELGAFNSLTALTTLTLQHYRLDRLPLNIFSDLKNCSAINLQDNYMSAVDPGAFNGFNALGTLTICRIERLPINVFRDVKNCSRLNLSNNQITELESGTFNGLNFLKNSVSAKQSVYRIEG